MKFFNRYGTRRLPIDFVNSSRLLVDFVNSSFEGFSPRGRDGFLPWIPHLREIAYINPNQFLLPSSRRNCTIASKLKIVFTMLCHPIF